MPRRSALLALVLCASPLSAQLPPDQALAALKPGDGLQVELFAAEPMLLNPTSIDVDHLGRVWVAEAVNYRRVNFNRPILREAGDRIVILTDKDGDGKADASDVFYQGKELYGPLSVLALKNAKGPGWRVLVAQSPDILEFADADGDGKADGPPQKFLTGFGGFDHDHGVHGLTTGPDGKLYFTVGDSGVKGLQAKDGKGPKFVSNKTDVQGGTVWRCDLDGANLELIAHNFRNNYEAAVDSFGEIWLSDNDDDGNQQTRICFVMPGGNYGYFPRGAGQSHWHEEQPGIVHKTLRTGFGSPTGIAFYEGQLFGPSYVGGLLHCDAGPREVRCFRRTPKGAGYELSKEVMLTSSDNFFRPSDVCVAPDGSIFVADWYDRGVGGHGMGDPKDGRIYRITPKGHKGYKVPKVERPLAAFASPNTATRHLGVQALTAKPWTETVEALTPAVVQTANVPLRGRAAVLATHVMSMEPKTQEEAGTLRTLSRAVVDPKSPELRAIFFRELAQKELPEFTFSDRFFGNFIGDKSPVVAREIALLLRGAPPAAAARWLPELANKYDGQDHFYRAALNIALGTDPARRDAILADFDKHFPEWNDTVADLVWELRPKSVMPRLEKLLAGNELNGLQKARIVDILAASDDAAAGKTVLALFGGDAPAEVKSRALDNLRLFLPTKWAGLAKSDDFAKAVDALLAKEETRLTGLQLVQAATHYPSFGKVVRLANAKDDASRPAAVVTLGMLTGPHAVDALIPLATDPAVTGGAVDALAAQIVGRGESEGAKKALAALERLFRKDTGDLARRAGLALAGTRAGTVRLLELKEKGEFPEALASGVAPSLRNSPFQGERNKALLLFPVAGKLDPKKLPPAAELARRPGDAANGAKVLAKSLSNEVQCLKCHAVRGQGGQIGPDLSLIGKKASKENLFESILQPSKAIADQYVSWKIDTADGASITGLLVTESESTVTIRDANGKDYAIAKGDVEKRSKSLVSLMPDNLVAGLTEQELVDLVAHLATLQTPALTPSEYLVAGPFPAADMASALKEEFAPEKGPFSPQSRFPVTADGDGIGWKPVSARADGYLDLAALHGPKGQNSASYVALTVTSPADQPATLLLGTDDAARLWVNGEAVWRGGGTRAAAPGQDRVEVKLKAGANVVLLKVANGTHPHGAYLTLLTSQEVKAGR